MASRTDRPATPTLVDTTDDNSRGGLFVQSNVSNEVGNTPVAAANDTTVTLTINDEIRTFTLNSAVDQTLEPITIATTADGADSFVMSGMLDTNNQLILTRNNGETVPGIDLSALAGGAGNPLMTLVFDNTTRILTATLMDGTTQIMSNAIDIGVQTVNGVAPDAAGNVVIDIPGGAIRGGNGTIALTGEADLTGLTIAESTGFQIVEVGTSGTYVFQRIPVTPPPVDPGDSSTRTLPPTSVFDTPVAPEIVTTITDAMPIVPGDVTTVVTRTPPGGTPTTVSTTPVTTVTGGDTVDVTVPVGDIDDEGDYDITTTINITPTDPDGDDDPIVVTTPFSRIVPFFQSRTQPTTGLEITTGTNSGAWTGTVMTIDGAAPLWLAVQDSDLATTVNNVFTQFGFPVNVSTRPAIMVNDSTGRAITYNIFRVAGVGGNTTLTNFNTR